MMSDKKDSDLVQKLKEALESVMPAGSLAEYPKEALPLGTYVRSIKHNKLGVVTDAYYGDVDKDNQKIIIYTILMFPDADSFSSSYKSREQYYVSNEYEYEIYAYLMIPPVDLAKLTTQLGGGLFL